LGVFHNGRLTAWIVVAAPPILLWGPGLKREALVFLLISLLLLALSLVYGRKYLVGGMLFLVVLGSFVTTRSSMLAVCGAGIIGVALLLAARKLNKSRIGHSLFARLLPVALVTFALALIPQAIHSASVVFSQTNLLGLGLGIPELSDPGQATAVPSASGEFNSSSGGLLYNFLRTIVGPVPWEVTNLSLLIFWIEGLGYLLLLAGLLHAYFSIRWLRGRILLLVVTGSPLFLAATLLLANYGLNSRIRAHIFLILVLFLEPYAAHLSGIFTRLGNVAAPGKPLSSRLSGLGAEATGHDNGRTEAGHSIRLALAPPSAASEAKRESR
jgi:hypothetical protein